MAWRKDEAIGLGHVPPHEQTSHSGTNGCIAPKQLLAFQVDAFSQVPVRFCCLLASGPWGHLLIYPFYSSSKALRPPGSPGVFGTLQSFKEDKAKPVRDEYEYVSDDGELKIDEFPIRRKKNAPKRDLSCECGGRGQEVPGSRQTLEASLMSVCCAFSLTGQEGGSPQARRKAKAGLCGIQGESASCALSLCSLLLLDVPGYPPSPCLWTGLSCGVGIGRAGSRSVHGTKTSCTSGPDPWEINAAKLVPK